MSYASGTELTSDSVISLESLRERLIRQEETIIFALIERAQWAYNQSIYIAGDLDVPASAKGYSFLDYFFCEIEKVHAGCRRYTSPDEHAFFPNRLPAPFLPLLSYPQVIMPNTINLNHKIKSLYIEKILKAITPEGDDKQYGSAANADVAVLQALSKRIHYGKFVAEAKFQAEPESYKSLILAEDYKGIMAKLTNKEVEENLLSRVRTKARNYGKEVNNISEGSLPEIIVSLYRDHIIPLTKEVQLNYLLERVQGASISYLGPAGTFSQQVAIKYFKHSTSSSSFKLNYVPVEDIKEVFLNVLSNKTMYGIVPIENSQTGIIHPHLNLLIENPVKVNAEVYLPISFCLCSNSKLEDIRVIYSHQQGFQQCSGWIKAHLPHANQVSVSSTANAAGKVTKEENSAVLGSSLIASTFNLNILAANIEETRDNMTRFFVISKNIGEGCGKDKTLLTFGTKNNAPGALHSVLSVFASKSINLTTIESYPTKETFGYGFFIEMEGHIEDMKVKEALEALKEHTNFIQVKGSFPVASFD